MLSGREIPLSNRPLPPHPRLLFDQQGISALKERIERCEWAKKRWRTLLHHAEEWLKEAVALPPRGGNWYHYYACPEHGSALRTGKRIGEWQWEHICPVDNKRLRSDPTRPEQDYDGCVLMTVHGQMANRVRDLGILYQVTGDRRYADKALEIACLYAERYAAYPLHTIRGEARIGGGKVGPQTLDEAVWLIPMAQGADLIWQVLSESERNLLTQKLFQPAVREVILPHQMGVHNIQCWKDSAVGLVGLLTGDEELIQQAIYNSQRGYWTQMRQGVTADGMWWEGAWGYHFYTLSSLWPLTEAARHCGINLYGEELLRMFDAPFRFMMPNFRLPAFNDSTEVNLRSQAPAYELAYARYKNPLYLVLLASANRENDYALWFGEESLPKPRSITWHSANYPASGYAILAKGRGEKATWLCLKYGPHGSGHGHPDKLHFELYSEGASLSTDPGMARYGVPIHGGWYRTTLAHNTLVVDETDQQATEGKCLAYGQAKGADYVVAEAGAIYSDMRFVRALVLLSEEAVVVLDDVQCRQSHRLDSVMHLLGEWMEKPAGKGWTPPDKPGYRYLTEAVSGRMDEGLQLVLKRDTGGLVVLSLLSDGACEWITALGIGQNAGQRVPALILRRRAKAWRLAWGIGLRGKPLTLAWLTSAPDASALQVTLPNGTVRRITLQPTGTPVLTIS